MRTTIDVKTTDETQRRRHSNVRLRVFRVYSDGAAEVLDRRSMLSQLSKGGPDRGKCFKILRILPNLLRPASNLRLNESLICASGRTDSFLRRAC